MIIDEDGNKWWYLNDKKHREDGPAVEFVNGSKLWYLNGEQHRVDGPAAVYVDGGRHWYLNGKLHRIDAPAIEWGNGYKTWYLHGKELVHPEEFVSMEEWFLHLNNNEEYSYQFINDIEGLIEIIKNPTPKQKRLNQMKWVL